MTKHVREWFFTPEGYPIASVDIRYIRNRVYCSSLKPLSMCMRSLTRSIYLPCSTYISSMTERHLIEGESLYLSLPFTEPIRWLLTHFILNKSNCMNAIKQKNCLPRAVRRIKVRHLAVCALTAYPFVSACIYIMRRSLRPGRSGRRL